MKAFSDFLILELEQQLVSIMSKTEDPIKYSEQSIKIIILILGRLKTFLLQYKFKDNEEEIYFFKFIKPRFVSKLIYYNDIYNIEINKPYGGIKVLRKYFNLEFEKKKNYFTENIDFYRYYRTGNTFLDQKYFLRGEYDMRFKLDSYYFEADHRFTTSHDLQIAKIEANELIKKYLETELLKLENNIKLPMNHSHLQQKWTGSKIALIELIYALHAEGVFNNGKTDLKETAKFFETIFDVDLGQFHRTFFEMRARKSERTKFLNSLRDTLVRRMDEVDETI